MTSLTLELRRAIDSLGGRKKFDEQAKQYRSDAEYLERNRESLLQEYPDRWVAVYRDEIQAVASTIRTLLTSLEKKQLSPNEVVISFLSTKETITLF